MDRITLFDSIFNKKDINKNTVHKSKNHYLINCNNCREERLIRIKNRRRLSYGMIMVTGTCAVCHVLTTSIKDGSTN